MDPLSGLAPDRSGFNVLPALATEEREGPLSSGSGLQDEEVVSVLVRDAHVPRRSGEGEPDGHSPDVHAARLVAVDQRVGISWDELGAKDPDAESASGLLTH